MKKSASELSFEFSKLAKLCQDNSTIDSSLYQKYDVKRGLRDKEGKGVLTGLTQIATVLQHKEVDGKLVPADGRLYYRGVNVNDLIAGARREGRYGFEETVFLLLFGKLPDAEELATFTDILSTQRRLPKNFVRDVIMKVPTADIMSSLVRCIMTLSSYDKRAGDTSIDNVTRQCIDLIAVTPLLAVYSYHAFRHYRLDKPLYIAPPREDLSIAENILYMLRPNGKYSELEAQLLDAALTLHAEHGGGNNSTFTMHVVTSSGTDTYSAMAAALCSLKGPKHGGANIKVVQMFEDLKRNVSDWSDDRQIEEYLTGLLRKKGFDHSGLIYGMGHAVYTISDPRCRLLKQYVRELSEELGYQKEFALYEKVEEMAPRLMAQERKLLKPVSANVDFYSGFAYRMLGLPMELFTPLFATARVAGWSAHRLEELISGGKIIRPAYLSVIDEQPYHPLSER
ncbi:MAG: citrate/2-methylcitrate synthase [Clostridia bacterium]|nr:citrate/2-methylcitrate synthase [Clostridia bacterium]